MQEAEALSDRIMIMKKGVIQCIGDSLTLKDNYAQFYTVSLTVKKSFTELCEKKLKKNFDEGVEIIVYNMNTLRFKVNFEKVKIVFKMMKDDREFKENILDWEFSQPSLDDVFMKLVEGDLG